MKHTLPPLPYELSALQPHISLETVELRSRIKTTTNWQIKNAIHL